MAIAAMRVPTIFTAVDRFSDVVSKMTAKTSAFGATAEASAMRTGRAFNSAGTKMLGAGVGMAVGIGYAVNEALKFEKAISNVSTLTDNTPAEMKKIGDSILEMSKKTPIAMSDLTTGMYDVVSAGITGTANQLEVLKQSSILAVAGLGTTKEAVDITTSSLNAFGIESQRAGYATNLLMKAVKYGKTTVSGISESFGAFASIMKNSNVGLDEYLASAAALTTTGMSMSRAQTQVSSATTALIKPNNTMAKIYQRLGVKDVPTFIKQSGGLVGALSIVNDEAKKMGLLMGKVMGRKEGLSALLSLLGAQKGKFKEIMNDMAGGADTVNVAFAKQQQTLAAKIQLMKNNLTVLAVRIGDVLIPRIKDLVDTVVPAIQNITAWSERNRGFANTLMTVAKWLLILGVVAKVGAFLFYGLGRILAFVSFVTTAYSAATSLLAAAQLAQAFSGASLTAVMWGLATSLLAVYWPVLLILGALGILAYSMADFGGGVEDMANKQISALDKSNGAWMNSTKIQQRELQKQRSLMETHNPNAMGARSGVDKTVMGLIQKNKNDKAAKMQRLSTVPIQSLSKNAQLFDSTGKPTVANDIYGKQRSDAVNGTPRENLAGQSSNNMLADFMKSKSGKLELEVTAPDGYGVDVVGETPKGIDVITKSNQGSR